eukprot:gene9582-6737_t
MRGSITVLQRYTRSLHPYAIKPSVHGISKPYSWVQRLSNSFSLSMRRAWKKTNEIFVRSQKEQLPKEVPPQLDDEKHIYLFIYLFLTAFFFLFLNKLKSVVSKTAGSKASALTTTSKPSSFSDNLSKIISSFGEKEWQCPCGHKFRDSGEWVVGSPALCEVPSCPNKRFYIDGPGRALLEANPGGIAIKPATEAATAPQHPGPAHGTSGYTDNCRHRYRGRHEELIKPALQQ